jgi:predicted nucleotidyltransferase
MTDFESLLAALDRNRVEYIVVGGAAALARGSARFTQDLDVVYSRSPENLDRIVSALADLKPYLRGVLLAFPSCGIR